MEGLLKNNETKGLIPYEQSFILARRLWKKYHHSKRDT